MHSLEFKLPDLGEGLTEAEIVRWLVEVGDLVAVDQPVVEVETAKAMVEVPCPYGGVVTARFGEEGTELPVGAPLITVAVGAPASGTETEGSGNVLVGYGTSDAPARRRRVKPGQPAPVAPSREANGHGGTPGPADGPVPVISPLVRRLARQNDLDLREMTGSGPDGLILRADVEYALRAAGAQAGMSEPPAEAPARVTSDPAPVPAAANGLRVPLKGIRGAVADKLSRSRREIPDATCWVDADATELMR
ncbi:MAG TPA: biotin/lipoyl-containing protein, partial [Phytomonospora sp.]